MRGCKQPVHNAERTRPPTGNTYSQRQLKSRAPLNRLAQHIFTLMTQTIHTVEYGAIEIGFLRVASSISKNSS